MRVVVVGTGRAASALGPRWAAAGHEVVSWSRAAGEIGAVPAADVVVLAVPDSAIVEVARGLGTRASAKDEIWLHLSGVHAASVLRVADGVPRAPRSVGCLHPLIALAAGADPRGAVAGVEGEAEAVAAAEALARAVGLVPHAIPAERALYHAAAVTVAGHATALFAQAMRLLEASGFERDAARAALQPLLASAAGNLARGAPEAVITGPIARGDHATVRLHVAALTALGERGSDVLAVYRALAAEALRLSEARLPPAAVAAISAALTAPAAGSR